MADRWAVRLVGAAGLLFVTILASPPSIAGETVPPLRLDMGAEYYLPTSEDREIHSVFVNALFGVEVVPRWITIAAGLTLTGAWGHIIQWNDDWEDVRYDTGVFGGGPMIIVRVEPLRVGWFSLALDVSGALLVYSARFPPGGDWYNMSWRVGGVLGFRITDRLTLTAGARWMHVSNGQGLGGQNPSYEGVGFPVGIIWRIRGTP